MYRLSVAEYQFQTTTAANRQLIKQMAEELAQDMGIDWEFEYRWMILDDESFLMANLKYPRIVGAMKAARI